MELFWLILVVSLAALACSQVTIPPAYSDPESNQATYDPRETTQLTDIGEPNGASKSSSAGSLRAGETLPATVQLRVEGGKVFIQPPGIEGLTIRQTKAGSVEYIDEKGRVILIADARFLNTKSPEEQKLKRILEAIYPSDSRYLQLSTFPRFRFSIEGINAGFFALEESLTYLQILRMKEALEVFHRPEFAPFLERIFTDKISYIVTEELAKDISGLNFAGTRIVLLDRRELFGNKYLLASVIGHEGSHVLQGPTEKRFTCDEALRREVGDQTIPANLNRWKADKLLDEVVKGKLGAYHVTYWILMELGFNNQPGLRQVIQTGMINGESVVLCK